MTAVAFHLNKHEFLTEVFFIRPVDLENKIFKNHQNIHSLFFKNLSL